MQRLGKRGFSLHQWSCGFAQARLRTYTFSPILRGDVEKCSYIAVFATNIVLIVTLAKNSLVRPKRDRIQTWRVETCPWELDVGPPTKFAKFPIFRRCFGEEATRRKAMCSYGENLETAG